MQQEEKHEKNNIAAQQEEKHEKNNIAAQQEEKHEKNNIAAQHAERNNKAATYECESWQTFGGARSLPMVACMFQHGRNTVSLSIFLRVI